LLGLAILEHVLMMIPYSLERVWNWALKPHKTSAMPNDNRAAAPPLEDHLMMPIGNTRLASDSGIDTK
jgi:hypothetical protein